MKKSYLNLIVAIILLQQWLLPSAPAQERLYWDGTAGATWNDASNWIFFNLSSSVITPGTIPGPEDIPYFDNAGPGDSIGTLGANQSVLGLFFENLADPFTIGDLAESFTLTIGTSGIVIGDAGFGSTPVTTAAATINSNLAITVTQIWANQSATTFTAAGNLTLGANLTLTDDPLGTNNSNGTFVLGSAGKIITQSLANRTITVQDTGAATELTINGELALTESATTGRRLFINTATDAAVLINGNITNGAGGASGLTKQGNGTLTIAGDLLYTSGNGTVVDGGTININGAVSTAGGAFVANNNSIINFNATTFTGTGGFTANGTSAINFNTSGYSGSSSFTASGGTLNLDAATYAGTGTFAVGSGGTFNLNAANHTGTNTWNIINGQFNVTTVNTNLNVNTLLFGQEFTPSTATLNATGYSLNLTGSIVTRRVTAPITLNNNLNFNSNHIIEVWDNAADQDLVIEGDISQSAAAGFTKTRAGTLVIRGTNSTTGENFFGHGRVVLDYTTNNTSKLGSGNQNLGGVDVDFIGNNSTATEQQVGSLNVFARGSNNINLAPGTGQTLTLKATSLNRGPTDSGIGGTINFILPTTSSQVEIASADNPFVGSWATIQDDTSSYFAAISDGKLIKATSTSPNDLLASQWAPTLVNQNVTDDTGFTGTTDYMAVNSLRIAASNPLNVIENLHVASGGILNAQDSTSTGIFGGTLTSGLIQPTFGAELIITQHSSTDFEIQSSIRRADNTAGGAVNITKAGTGTLILSGQNQTSGRTNATTASGTLFLNEGTVVLKGGNALSDNTDVLFDPRANATLELADSETIGSLTTANLALDGESTVDIGTHNLTIKQSGTQTYSGAFEGSGTIIKDNLDRTANSIATLTLNTTSHSSFTGDLQINRGIVLLSGNGVQNLSNVNEIRINQGGGLIIDHTNATLVLNRLNNSADVVLNGANGRASTTTAIRGLNMRSNQGNVQIETINNLVINSGASYATLEALSTTSGSAMVIQASSIIRNNGATLSVRGTNLAGPGSVGRTRLRLAPNSTAAVAFANQFRTGGIYANGASSLATTGAANNGAATAKDISIVSWAVGETFSGNTPGATNDGNSFVAYNSDDLGFTPLHLVNQYSTYTAAATTHNVRESLTADLAMGAGKNINSLLINNQNNTATLINLTGDAGTNLSVTSGAFLFTGVGAPNASGLATQNATQGGIVIRGFDGIEISGTNKEYIMFANNMSTAGTTIESALITAATFTKSGQGLLHLKGTNDALTDVTINEGTLRIDTASNLGGNDGAINLAGGILQLGTDWNTATSGSLENRTINVLDGITSSLDTNAALRTDLTNNLTIGAMTGTGTFIKQGLGTLTLGGSTASTFTGLFVVEGASGFLQDDTTVLLNNTGGNAIAGDIIIGKLNSAPAGRSILKLGRSDQIADTSVITISSASGVNGFFALNGFDETVAGIVNTNREGVIQVAQSLTLADPTSTLTVAGSGDYYFDGYLRNSAGGNGVLSFNKEGTGTQTLSGDRIVYTGNTVLSGGLLRLRDTIGFNSIITNNASLELENTGVTWDYTRAINGSGNVRKAGTGTTTLAAASTYSGVTDIDAGTLTLGAAGSINNSSAINIKHGATLDVSAKGPAGYDYGHLLTGGGTVTGNINLISGGSLRPGASTNPTAAATTGDQLGALNITGNLGLTGGYAVLQITSPTLNDAGVAAAYTAGAAALTAYLNTNADDWNATTYTDANGVPKHDYVDVSGDFTWNNGSTITYTGINYNPTVGDILNLWDWTNLGGTFNLGADASLQREGGLLGDLELPDFDGILYDLSLFRSHGIAVVVIIPEPSRAVLLLLGLSSLVLRRRRQR
ncbi:beta strand repeat-containing protein [Phragmitibacter flavus]|uniref:beta strand repeat-containing protein n=1 Tax=Phragmitibacter flavus TaxID=2576071 RepID=UPI0014087C03|nr:autotransporter-associated beta strand repeat-containing protein [Phragmitibacter flavus]